MYLDIIALVVIAALSEESMGNDTVDVQFIKHRIGVLVGERVNIATNKASTGVTLLRLAVKMTISYISPIFFMKLSTPGRFKTWK